MTTYAEGSITSIVDPRPRRTTFATAGRWRSRRLTVATIVIASAAVFSGCDTEPDAPSSNPATLAVDRFFEVFNSQDADELARIFGDDVVLTVESGAQAVGADIATFWQQFVGLWTGERITDALHGSAGRTYFLAEFAPSSGSHSNFQVFDMEMDGERLVSMGVRPQNLVEVDATSQIDNVYAAFNAQDLDQLTDAFEGITYTSPSGEDFTGAQAAEHWADEFGSTITRTTGVFALGDGSTSFNSAPATAVFVREHTEPAGSSTAYTVDVEMSRGRITSMTERTQ